MASKKEASETVSKKYKAVCDKCNFDGGEKSRSSAYEDSAKHRTQNQSHNPYVQVVMEN